MRRHDVALMLIQPCFNVMCLLGTDPDLTDSMNRKRKVFEILEALPNCLFLEW